MILLISTGACQISEPSAVFPKLHTLPKTNNLPLKIDDWNAVETKKDLDWMWAFACLYFDILLMEKNPAPYESYLKTPKKNLKILCINSIASIAA